MPQDAQAILKQIDGFIARNRVVDREDYGFGAVLASLPRPAPAADPELDALLDTLDEVAANDDTPANERPVLVPCLVKSATPRTRRRKRRSGLRQKEDAQKMRAGARAEAGEVVEHLHPHTSTSKTTSSKTKTSAPKARTRITTRKRARMIASWEDAGELPRLIACNRALAELGQPFAFSMNLDPMLIAAANDNARGPLDHVRRRVVRAVQDAYGGARPLWVVLETDDDGRLHVHGGVALNDNDLPGRLEASLAKFGGGWTRRGSAPADVRAQWEPDGWAVYPLKRFERTRRHLRASTGKAAGAHIPLLSISDDLRVVGRRIHAEVRGVVGRLGGKRSLT